MKTIGPTTWNFISQDRWIASAHIPNAVGPDRSLSEIFRMVDIQQRRRLPSIVASPLTTPNPTGFKYAHANR